jgi:hypothetical protein
VVAAGGDGLRVNARHESGADDPCANRHALLLWS